MKPHTWHLFWWPYNPDNDLWVGWWGYNLSSTLQKMVKMQHGENGESNATHWDVVNRILSANRNSNFTINLFSISVTSQSLLGNSPSLQGKSWFFCWVNPHFLLVNPTGKSPQKPTAFPGQETLHEVQRWRSSRRARVGRQQKWNQIGRLLKLFIKFTAIEPNILWGCNGNVDIDNACVCTYIYIITVCTYSNGVQPNNKWELPRRNGANKQWFDVTWCHPNTGLTYGEKNFSNSKPHIGNHIPIVSHYGWFYILISTQLSTIVCPLIPYPWYVHSITTLAGRLMLYHFIII